MNIRFIKVWRDLTTELAKNGMLALAIAIGVFGIGCILGGYSVVKREMDVNYQVTRPASATIELESPVSRQLVDSVKTLPGIGQADRRATLLGRIKIHDKWYPLLLFVMDDFTNLPVSKFRLLSGRAAPPLGTMLVERTALAVMDATEGDKITVKTQHGTPRAIRIVGTVHDPSLAPAGQEQTGYAYISLETLQWLGERPQFDQLKIRVSTRENSEEYITQQAQRVANWLEKRGYGIHEIQVPPPNRHPHQSQMDAIMTIFIVFSFLILILASLLVSVSMATLMVKQVRQIGVMKTIGATSGQIAGLYLFRMLVLCALALAVGVPLSRLAAASLYTRIAILLNLELTNTAIPFWVLLVQTGAGLLIPLLVVAVPVVRGSQLPIRRALDNYGLSRANRVNSGWVARVSQLRLVSDSARLSLRNVFRQPSRLTLTLGLLAAGGAMFMTALNVSEAWNTNLSRMYTQRLYDLEIRMNQPIRTDSIRAKLKAIPGVTVVEAGSAAPVVIAQDGPYDVTHTYPDKGHGSFTMQAIPVQSVLLQPTLTEGRWLNTPDASDVVLNQLARQKGVKIGDPLRLSVDGKVTSWTVVGFTEDVGTPATAYVSTKAYARTVDTTDRANWLRLAFTDRSKAFVAGKTPPIEALLAREGISVRSTIPVWLVHNAVAAHMRILINSLLAMAVLMALVGTIGLLSTMSMSIMERTREIGVMRSIGATPAKIRNLIVWEGFFIGAFSVVLALLLSVGLSVWLGRFIGNLSFRTPLGLSISPLAVVIWTGLIALGSYVATILPARRANRLTTREALTYE